MPRRRFPSELLRLARTGRRARPVFVVGEARSGTTLLYRLLQQQPAFGPEPPHIIESFFLQRLLTEPDLEARSWPMRNYLRADDEAWDRFTTAAGPLLAVRRAALRARPSSLGRPRVAAATGVGVLARAYVGLALEVRGATRLVEKTPDHLPFTHHILRWFPGATVLYVVRHPVDVITSYWKRAERDERAAGWARLATDEFVGRYATNSALAQRYQAAHPGEFAVVRYEDLVAEPEQTLAGICRLAGAPFDPAAIVAIERDAPAWDPAVWSEPQAHTKDWRDYIDERTAAELEDRVASTMSALGYPRYTRM